MNKIYKLLFVLLLISNSLFANEATNWLKKEVDYILDVYKNDNLSNIDRYNLPRHKYQNTYEANGIIDIYKTKNILKGTLLGTKVFPFLVSDINSDIDDLEDFKYVKYFVKKNKFKI